MTLVLHATGSHTQTGWRELINMVAGGGIGGARVVLTPPSPFVPQVFNTTRLAQWFDIVPDQESAAAALA